MHADRAIGYIRVSTEEQELGPEAQRAAIEAYARAHGLTIVAWAEELGMSGAAPLDERTTLWEAFDSAWSARAAVFLVAKRDRLSRELFTMLLLERELETRGVRIESADGAGNGTGPEADLLRGMLGVIAQYERALIRVRTKAALAAKVRRGERSAGSIPYGKRLALDGRTLEDDPAEVDVIVRIARARELGKTFQEITDRLNAEGTPARGKRWHITTVQRILRR